MIVLDIPDAYASDKNIPYVVEEHVSEEWHHYLQ